MNRTLCGLAMMVLLLAGCNGGASTERTTGADGKLVNVSRLTTGFPPRETADRAVAVMKRLQFQPAASTGLFGGKDWVVRSDYFSATARANTAAGEAIELVATWESEGKTALMVRSTLSEAQHGHLLDQIVAGMKQ